MKRALPVLIAVCLLIGGCKKYEEDHRTHWKNPIRRIAQDWEIVKYQINGIDSLSTRNFVSNRIAFSRQLNYDALHIQQADNNIVFSSWRFANEDSEIWVDGWVTTAAYDHNPFVYLVDSSISTNMISGDWTIRKLTNKEFALESIHSNNIGEIRIEMAKIKD